MGESKFYCNFSISEKGVLASLTSDKLGILRNSCLPTPGLPVAHGQGYPVAGKFQKLLVPLSPNQMHSRLVVGTLRIAGPQSINIKESTFSSGLIIYN